MADPVPYTRTYSFTDFQAGNPSAPLPGVQVDNELENVETSLGEAVNAIKDIRRSDGALNNGIVTVDSLDATVAAGVGSGALASAAAAAASADAASDSAVASAASATASAGSATTASGYASTALTYRNEAETERTLAQTARTGAQTARDYANKWATEAEDVNVDDGVNPVGQSAYHWSQKAAASAASAALPPIVADTLLGGNVAGDAWETKTFADVSEKIGGFVTLADAQDAYIDAPMKRISTQFYAPNYAVPATLVGGANYKRVSFADLTGYPTQSYFRSVDRLMPDGTTDATNGGYWVVDEPVILAEMLGALGDGTTDDAPSINAAIVLASLLGGRTISLQAKTYAVGNQNSGAVSTFDHWAIVFDQGHDNVELVGVPGATKIKLINAANCTVIQIGRNTNTAPPNRIRIAGIEIDGNRANQDAPLASTKHWPGLMAFIFGGVSERIIIEDMYIHDCQYYGIGFEMEDVAGTEFHDCHVRNVVIEDTGADGFDAKDYQNGSYGNTIENITVRRWGLANAASALLSGQAGIDLRSGWVVENAFIDEGNAATIPDQVGIRMQRGSLGATATPVQPSRVSKFMIRGSNGATSVGLRIISIYNTATDGHIEGFVDGISVSNQHCKLENIVSKLNETGARFWATGGTTATLSSAEGCIIRDNTGTGVVVAGVDSVSLVNTHVRSNLVGINIDASSPNFVFIGGSLSGNTTQATITTVVPYIRNVVGFRTKRTYSTTGAVDSLGSKDITFAHGLSFTPRIQDCQVSFRQSSALTDWAAAFLEVLSTDATNVVARYRVDTASGTAGALVGVNLIVDAYNGV